MRQRALILIAAVTLCTSATAQHVYFPRTLILVKSYDISNINKQRVIHHTANSNTEDRSIEMRPTYPLSPQLDFSDLKNHLGNDIRHLKLEQRNQQWQGLFQGMMQNVKQPNTINNKL